MSTPDVSTSSISLEWPLESVYAADWETRAKMKALTIASRLTDPVCKVRENYYSFYIVDKLYDTTLQRIEAIAYLALGIVAYGLLTPFSAPLGIFLRALVSTLESKPFIYLAKAQTGKVLPEDKKISVVSHNQCYMPGGFSITDGQVKPANDKKRMDANLEKIKALKPSPDLICLYEVPDICDALYLSSRLPDYPFLIPVAGIRAIGPSSMMYVASKYEIDPASIAFVPFEKGTELTGRAQYSEKGVLSFSLKSQGVAFATVFSTHLQHSEIPAEPTPEDVAARALQMQKIQRQIQERAALGENIIFTGDLNQEESELHTEGLRRDHAVQRQATWGGDEWCANLMGKPDSGPLVLDYTFIAGKAVDISTTIHGTDFSGSEFKPNATSDHSLLHSIITLG